LCSGGVPIRRWEQRRSRGTDRKNNWVRVSGPLPETLSPVVVGIGCVPASITSLTLLQTKICYFFYSICDLAKTSISYLRPASQLVP